MLDSSPKNKPIGIVGFGELASQLLNYLELSENEVTIFDDSSDHPFSFTDYEKYLNEYHWVIGIGYKHLALRNKIYHNIINADGHLLDFKHTSCYIDRSAKVGSGSFIYPMSNIDKGVKIGGACIINNSVTISHDTIIGDACYISPGVTFSGMVNVGHNVFIGSGSTISNGVKIGNDVIIGVGSVITKDIPSDSCVIGNPMVFKDRIELI